MITFYIYCVIFFCIAYLIITDQLIAKAFIIVCELIRLQYQKTKWWITHSPDNFVVRWLIHRRSMKIAKELMKELEEKNK